MRLMRNLLTAGLVLAWSCVFAQLASVLERNGSVSWKFLGGQYEITGAVNLSGNVTPSDPLVFLFQDLNGDGVALDVRLDMTELFPGFGINYTIDLIGTVLSDSASEADILWRAADTPNQCVTVNVGFEVTAFITYLEGGLRGRITRIECQPDPFGVREGRVTLYLEPTGGDDSNYLLAQGYLLCQQDPQYFATARIFDMDWLAYGGGSAGGDVDSNGCVDDADLLSVLFAFGSDQGGCADVNGDGIVDDADLLTVLFNFGSGC
ncbi:MAG: hypothetical protein KatS3mg021_1396 [Fimbriimonadales bacterium]|nr:MAG: hypothetical protein KatS3mg021_1396 [Fimbriimonadales bacterium]